jgi:hypothetical protein
VKENPPSKSLLRTARREAVVSLLAWLSALVYTVGYCYLHGYRRPVEELRFVWGFPDWIFWGVVVPWVFWFAFSVWYAFWFMQDTPMDDGEEQPARGDDA